MTLLKLTSDLLSLRQTWPKDWVGIPQIFEQCLKQLQADQALSHAGTASLVRAGQQIAILIENSCTDMADHKREPAYHSRLHTGNALVSLAALLLAQRELDACPTSQISEAEALMMLAMVGHDALHTGGRNAFPTELEQRSLMHIEPLLVACGVRIEDIDAVRRLILLTEPTRVKTHHQTTKATAFNIADLMWQATFIQEADILASSLPELQEQLTRELSREAAADNPVWSAELVTPTGRRLFLENAALFSTPAAHALGLNDLVKDQLAALQG
jgi:hypothetical protein